MFLSTWQHKKPITVRATSRSQEAIWKIKKVNSSKTKFLSTFWLFLYSKKKPKKQSLKEWTVSLFSSFLVFSNMKFCTVVRQIYVVLLKLLHLPGPHHGTHWERLSKLKAAEAPGNSLTHQRNYQLTAGKQMSTSLHSLTDSCLWLKSQTRSTFKLLVWQKSRVSIENKPPFLFIYSMLELSVQ